MGQEHSTPRKQAERKEPEYLMLPFLERPRAGKADPGDKVRMVAASGGDISCEGDQLTGRIGKGTFQGDRNVLGLERVVGPMGVNTFILNESE